MIDGKEVIFHVAAKSHVAQQLTKKEHAAEAEAKERFKMSNF
jgi:hypothetical protein